MLEREFKYKRLRMMEIFYARGCNKNILKDKKYKHIDILKINQVDIKYNESFRPFHTLHIDLHQPVEEIFRKFKSNYRNEINKNMRDDGVDYKWISMASLDEMKEIHEDLLSFSKFKGWDVNEELEMGRTVDFLDNCVISHAKLNGMKIASHVYFVDTNERARLRFSVSYRMDDSIDFKLVGRSNKALHWFDMQELKKIGINIYDFGGAIRIDKNRKILGGGISGFKKGFSDNLVTEYTGEIPLTLKGKIATAVWIFLKKK
jgi:lipid II:glycine glycyltransferase (peptidoglycan interpeptide bridge formation enzyme)